MVHVLAFGFGTGLAPYAPGTVGSLLGVALAWITHDMGLIAQIAMAAGLFLAGIPICGESAKRLGIHDHGGIVWDEIVGMYLVLIFTPSGLYWWIAAFGLFRAFDIVKPWPIRDLDHRLKGGLGIMLDDLVAALYAALLLAFMGWLMT
jgi:phosphatidylglycerophosphatase A